MLEEERGNTHREKLSGALWGPCTEKLLPPTNQLIGSRGHSSAVGPFPERFPLMAECLHHPHTALEQYRTKQVTVTQWHGSWGLVIATECYSLSPHSSRSALGSTKSGDYSPLAGTRRVPTMEERSPSDQLTGGMRGTFSWGWNPPRPICGSCCFPEPAT